MGPAAGRAPREGLPGSSCVPCALDLCMKQRFHARRSYSRPGRITSVTRSCSSMCSSSVVMPVSGNGEGPRCREALLGGEVEVELRGFEPLVAGSVASL